MKFRKFFAIILAVLLALSALTACSGENKQDTGNTDTGSVTNNNTGMNGTYKAESAYTIVTFIIEGEKITAIDQDLYYNNTSTFTGTISLADDDEDEKTVKYTITWDPREDETLYSLKSFTYDKKEKTLTTASSFQTYVLKKQ